VAAFWTPAATNALLGYVLLCAAVAAPSQLLHQALCQSDLAGQRRTHTVALLASLCCFLVGNEAFDCNLTAAKVTLFVILPRSSTPWHTAHAMVVWQMAGQQLAVGRGVRNLALCTPDKYIRIQN
jgi:hypothetical protein